MVKIVLCAVLAVGFFALVGCEAWERSRAGEIRVSDVIYLDLERLDNPAHPKVLAEHNTGPFGNSCLAEFGSTLTVVAKYESFGGVRNVLVRYALLAGETVGYTRCPDGLLISMTEREWLKIRSGSDENRERYLVSRFRDKFEEEAVKKYLESQKRGNK